MNSTHDPALRSWVPAANSATADFPVQNLPFGVFRRARTTDKPRLGVAIGDQILDLHRCRDVGLFDELSDGLQAACGESTLNPLMALGPAASSALRLHVSELLRADAPPRPELLAPIAHSQLLMPFSVGGYTDFYASIDHARNIGGLFRPDHPLLPNYQFVPIAYHGRTSSIVVSGTAIRRPCGQVKNSSDASPLFRPTARLDYEVEVAFAIGTGNALGEPIPVDDAESHVFGFCLLNDWSARDIQAWEYQPLGPFLGKNFATTISPWVVTRDALEPFRANMPARADGDPVPLAYLTPRRGEPAAAFDITVEVYLRSEQMRLNAVPPMRVSRGSFRDMYWSVAQMVAHHTCNGCNLTTGDLLASGTVSGPAPDSRGCLLEITRASEALRLPTGETRMFLEDGDEVTLRAYCEHPSYTRIGFGTCSGTIVPAQTHNSPATHA